MRHLTLNQEYQNQTAQLMFSFGEEQQYDIPVRQVTTCSKTDTKLSTVPEYLNNLSKDCFSLEELLGKINADTVYFGRNKRGQIANVNGNVIFAGGMASRILPNALLRSVPNALAQGEGYLEFDTFVVTLGYFDDCARLWNAKLNIVLDKKMKLSSFYSSTYPYNCTEFSLGKWSMVKKQKFTIYHYFIQSKEELTGILEKNAPYTAKWAAEKGADVRCMLLAPQIEILSKAGYLFADSFIEYDSISEENCVIFNRLCQQGTKPKDIFKTIKMKYSILKGELDLEIWDCYRKLAKLGKIDADHIQQAYDQNFKKADLEGLNSILSKQYDGKPVFTWNSLMQYLVRLDTFEAIEKKEAFMLLNDYLSMCNQLKMQPRINGDSLKREHDIAARNCRNRKNKIMAERMQNNCEKMKKYDYTEGVYFVRGIRSHDDLLDEANQQHNCVAAYGSRIANGSSYIYVLREVAKPDKSLITIELSPDGRNIRQKYLAYNQPVRNRSQSEFIDRWMKHNRLVG